MDIILNTIQQLLYLCLALRNEFQNRILRCPWALINECNLRQAIYHSNDFWIKRKPQIFGNNLTLFFEDIYPRDMFKIFRNSHGF